MEVVKAMIIQIINECEGASQLPELGIIIENLAKTRCTVALQDIYDIMHNPNLDDATKVNEGTRILQEFESGQHRMLP